MPLATPDLSGKLVLVTGATRGIGRAVAVAAANAGAELIITGRTIGALEEVDDEIKAIGGNATIVEMDMKDTAAMPRLAAAIAERWGRLDGLVANAAILTALTPVGHITPEDWEANIAVNLTGQWHLIRALDPLLRVAPAGRAILVTSGAAVGSRPFWAPYAATKAGLEALGRSWAGESEQTNLRINMRILAARQQRCAPRPFPVRIRQVCRSRKISPRPFWPCLLRNASSMAKWSTRGS